VCYSIKRAISFILKILVGHLLQHLRNNQSKNSSFHLTNQGSLTEGEGTVQLTSSNLDQLLFILKILYNFLQMRRSIVLSLPLQLVFPGLTIETDFDNFKNWLNYFFPSVSFPVDMDYSIILFTN
jgi:hypothetical protein